MKIYQTIFKNYMVFTFVSNGITHFIKNPKRQCNYGSYLILKYNDILQKYQVYNSFSFKRDASTIKSFINNSPIKEVKLYYVLDYIKRFVDIKEKAIMVSDFTDNIQVITCAFSSRTVRDVITYSELYHEILADKLKYSEYKNKFKRYSIADSDGIVFVKDICKYNFFLDEYEPILGYLSIPKSTSIFILIEKDLLPIERYSEMYMFNRKEFDEYEKLFMEKDSINIKEKVKNHIIETLNKKFSKRNEKRRFLRKNFLLLKSLMSLYPYL